MEENFPFVRRSTKIFERILRWVFQLLKVSNSIKSVGTAHCDSSKEKLLVFNLASLSSRGYLFKKNMRKQGSWNCSTEQYLHNTIQQARSRFLAITFLFSLWHSKMPPNPWYKKLTIYYCVLTLYSARKKFFSLIFLWLFKKGYVNSFVINYSIFYKQWKFDASIRKCFSDSETRFIFIFCKKIIFLQFFDSGKCSQKNWFSPENFRISTLIKHLLIPLEEIRFNTFAFLFFQRVKSLKLWFSFNNNIILPI